MPLSVQAVLLLIKSESVPEPADKLMVVLLGLRDSGSVGLSLLQPANKTMLLKRMSDVMICNTFIKKRFD